MLIFPTDKSDFAAPNGITYSWDATDGKWVIKSFAVEQREDFDPQLKEHVCAEFFEVVADYASVEAAKGHSMASYDFGNSGVKYWTKPPKAGFFVNGENYYVNDQGPYKVEQVDEGGGKWVTFFIQGGPQPAVGEFCKFSKTRKLCTEVAALNQDIIELEEEIDAIAPSVERGKWTFNAVGTVANAGQFTMYDADYGSGAPTGLFKSAKSIWLNEIDSDGTPHAFSDVDEGELLEIFVDGSPEYGLFEVVGQAHDETQGQTSFWVIDVNFVRTLETTTAVDTGDLCRFKIFMAPTGGDVSSFVMKAGDKMSGNLIMGDEFTPDTAQNSAEIQFISQVSNNTTVRTTLKTLTGNYRLHCSGSFAANGNLAASSSLCKWSGNTLVDGNTGFMPRIMLTNTGGWLTNATGGTAYDSTSTLRWDDPGITEMRFNNSIGETGQIPTKTDTGIEWVTPATADDEGPTNWDLVNSNNKNWGNEFYHQALTTGFGGYKSNGDEYNGQSNYGIFISDSMLEKLLKEDYPDKEIDIDKWVKYWTGEGTIELNTGNSGSSGTSQTRTLTEVKRVNYNNDGRYPGVKFMWADQYSLSFYSLYIKFVKTQDAFIGTETDSAGSQILMPLEFPQVSGGQYVNDDQVQTVNKNGSSTGSDVYGYNMPWAWFEKEYPDIIGWVNDDGSAFIGGTRATLTVNTGQTRPGLTIIGPYKINSYGNNLTIPGFVVRVDEVKEPQWGHKFP